MQLSDLTKKLIITALVLMVSLRSYAQENIQQQFEDFSNNQTSTWQEYRMIKMPRLKNFWEVVSDTIQAKEGKIAIARARVSALKEQLSALNTELKDTQDALSSSEERNDSIGFLGLQLNKAAYNTMVWLVIAGLVVGLVSLYFMYLNNNRTTREARKNLAKIEEEYTAHQDKARENQAKLKRELQTALNTLQEHRIKI